MREIAICFDWSTAISAVFSWDHKGKHPSKHVFRAQINHSSSFFVCSFMGMVAIRHYCCISLAGLVIAAKQRGWKRLFFSFEFPARWWYLVRCVHGNRRRFCLSWSLQGGSDEVRILLTHRSNDISAPEPVLGTLPFNLSLALIETTFRLYRSPALSNPTYFTSPPTSQKEVLHLLPFRN